METIFVKFVSLPGSEIQELAMVEGDTVKDVLEKMDRPLEGVVTVNGVEANFDTVVEDGSRIILTKKEVKNG
jgi:hypothetical protein